METNRSICRIKDPHVPLIALFICFFVTSCLKKNHLYIFDILTMLSRKKERKKTTFALALSNSLLDSLPLTCDLQ